MIQTDFIGRGYRLLLGERMGEEIWVCFGRRSRNPAILRLAPALPADGPETATLSAAGGEPAALIVDQRYSVYWLFRGIEVRLHEIDLEDPEVASPVGQFQMAGETVAHTKMATIASSAPSICNDIDELLVRFSQVATAIEREVYAREQNVYPQLVDCQIRDLDPGGHSASFFWRHDRNRGYRFFGAPGRWTLRQIYAAPDACASDHEAPLQIGDTLCRFAPDGSTQLPDALAEEIIRVFGLPFAASTPMVGLSAIRHRLHWAPPVLDRGALYASDGVSGGGAVWGEPQSFRIPSAPPVEVKLIPAWSQDGCVLELRLTASAPTSVRLRVHDQRVIGPDLDPHPTLEYLPDRMAALWSDQVYLSRDFTGVEVTENADGVTILTMCYASDTEAGSDAD